MLCVRFFSVTIRVQNCAGHCLLIAELCRPPSDRPHDDYDDDILFIVADLCYLFF